MLMQLLAGPKAASGELPQGKHSTHCRRAPEQHIQLSRSTQTWSPPHGTNASPAPSLGLLTAPQRLGSTLLLHALAQLAALAVAPVRQRNSLKHQRAYFKARRDLLVVAGAGNIPLSKRHGARLFKRQRLPLLLLVRQQAALAGLARPPHAQHALALGALSVRRA